MTQSLSKTIQELNELVKEVIACDEEGDDDGACKALGYMEDLVVENWPLLFEKLTS